MIKSPYAKKQFQCGKHWVWTTNTRSVTVRGDIITWKCAFCGCEKGDAERGVCTKCGLVQMGSGTAQKYQILREYCYPLSLIMRNNGFEHYFIDACAGSGIVQKKGSVEIVDGSPLIMAKTKEIVEEKIQDKTKEHSVKCKFIECNPKTFKILEESVSKYSDFVECIRGDCNEELDKILNDIPRAFTFIYVDPFGLGSPVIKHDTVQKILQRGFTELFMHWSWEGISRVAGELKNIDHPDEKTKELARQHCKTLDSYMGTEWREIWQTTPSQSRKRTILESCISKLKEHFENIQYVEIPVGNKNPDYYLIFTTRNKTGAKIMDYIIKKLMRKGSRSLQRFTK